MVWRSNWIPAQQPLTLEALLARYAQRTMGAVAFGARDAVEDVRFGKSTIILNGLLIFFNRILGLS